MRSPERRSNLAPCQGQTTVPCAQFPRASGPPECGQRPSIARISPAQRKSAIGTWLEDLFDTAATSSSESARPDLLVDQPITVVELEPVLAESVRMNVGDVLVVVVLLQNHLERVGNGLLVAHQKHVGSIIPDRERHRQSRG